MSFVKSSVEERWGDKGLVGSIRGGQKEIDKGKQWSRIEAQSPDCASIRPFK